MSEVKRFLALGTRARKALEAYTGHDPATEARNLARPDAGEELLMQRVAMAGQLARAAYDYFMTRLGAKNDSGNTAQSTTAQPHEPETDNTVIDITSDNDHLTRND